MTILKTKVFPSPEGNVWKYVFHIPEGITETVLYQYESFQKRTVICCSVQSGCIVGCNFCGTGKNFLRNSLPFQFNMTTATLDNVDAK